MAFFPTRTNTDLHKGYGYYGVGDGLLDFDRHRDDLERIEGQGYRRYFELAVAGFKIPESPKFQPLTQQEVDRFNLVCSRAFRLLGKNTCSSPTEVWQKLKKQLIIQDVCPDDCNDIELFCFGWKEFAINEMERYRYRVPNNCPLVDALYILDDSYEPLNELREWIYKMKSKQDSRDPKVMPSVKIKSFLKL